MDYAKTGELQVSEETGLEPDSDFEVFVMRALKNAGYDCVPQVGVKGFRIDIGVKVAGLRADILLESNAMEQHIIHLHRQEIGI